MYMPTAESSEGENHKSHRNDWNIDGEQAGPSQTEQGIMTLLQFGNHKN